MKQCPDCQSTEIAEDKKHREIYCPKCGRVLASAPDKRQNINFPFGLILG